MTPVKKASKKADATAAEAVKAVTDRDCEEDDGKGRRDREEGFHDGEEGCREEGSRKEGTLP